MKSTFNYAVKYHIIAKCITPFRTGNSQSEVDALLKNKKGEYFIQGNSLAGAFRNWVEINDNENTEYLFGTTDKSSNLIISDGVFNGEEQEVSRPRLRIDNSTGVAKDGSKFDVSHIQINSCFTFNLTLLLNEESTVKIDCIKNMLSALNNGEIMLGSHKTNGFGKVILETVTYQEYNMFDETHRDNWLDNIFDGEVLELSKTTKTNKVKFILSGNTANMLIKGKPEHNNNDSYTPNLSENGFAVLPGSSIKGAVKSRVIKIANLFNISEDKLEDIFGTSPDKEKSEKAGRVFFNDMIAKNSQKKKLPRIHIDKFTASVFDGGLFTEEPIATDINIEVTAPNDEITLALLFLSLRDLCLNLYNLGSGYAIGRGELNINQMVIKVPNKDDIKLTFNKEVTVEDKENIVESWIKALGGIKP